MDDKTRTTNHAPLIRGTSVPDNRVTTSLPVILPDPREQRTSLGSKTDSVTVPASNKQSPSKQTSGKPKPSRPPPPSPVALQRLKERRARSLSHGSCPPQTDQQHHDYEFDSTEGEDMHDTQCPQPRRSVLSETSTLSLTSQSSSTSRSSSSSIVSATVPNRTSTASSLDSTAASAPSDDSVYEPVDLSTPIVPPRRKKSIKKGHPSPKLNGSKDVPPELPPRGTKSDPLSRRKITPPVIPQKSQLARTIGLKASAAKETKLKPLVGTYTLATSPEAVDAPESVYIVPGEPEPDIGGVDEYVDMKPVSAWQLEKASTGSPHVTAEELAQGMPT